MAQTTCDQRKREVLQTLQGMVGEIEARRLFLLGVLEERPHLIEEVMEKINFLESSMTSINLALDYIESCEQCEQCQGEIGNSAA
jgi:hypothetical protein